MSNISCMVKGEEGREKGKTTFPSKGCEARPLSPLLSITFQLL